jgi:hypothetical protein
MSCTRSQEFLANTSTKVAELVRADKAPIEGDQAVAMARAARRLVVAKGKKLTVLEPGPSTPSDAELRALVVGPTGRLRAPALRIGDTLIVGFSADALGDALKRR